MEIYLLDIPREVIYSCLLPLLSVNDVLRTRRVCRKFRLLSEDYLRVQPRSTFSIQIFVPNESNNQYSTEGLTVKAFLDEEEKLVQSAAEVGADPPILVPTSRFHIKFESARGFENVSLGTFIKRYGHQVVHLNICRQAYPITEDELRFYEQLPNLRHLTIDHHREGLFEKTKEEANKTFQLRLPHPQVFSKLESLKVLQEAYNLNVPELAKACTNLTRFFCAKDHRCPWAFRYLLEIFEQDRHKKLQVLDMYQICPRVFLLDPTKYQQLLGQVFALVTKYNLKLVHADPQIFRKLNEEQLSQVAPRIVSLSNFELTRIYTAETYMVDKLPNVKSLELRLYERHHCRDLRQDFLQAVITKNLSTMTLEKMPSLRKVTIGVGNAYSDDQGLPPLFWNNFSHVEELHFQCARLLHDATFIGINGELPFLQLKKLKILNLGCLHMGLVFEDRVGHLTDASFICVFSQMKLDEFRFSSDVPLKYVRELFFFGRGGGASN